MKKLLLVLVLSLIMTFAKAQNIQFHYDFGEDRNYPTTTIEMFKPDKWGSTFFFVDMDYGRTDDLKGVNLAYFEIARTFLLSKDIPFSLHVEYNGGLFQANENITVNINDAWLAGIDYSWNNADFSAGYSLKALFKHIVDKHDASFQLTAVWYYHFLDRKMTFSGFMDFWKEDTYFDFTSDEETGNFVFLTEPQLWYNFTTHFSLGTEIELSKNFISEDFKVMPTAAIKWNF